MKSEQMRLAVYLTQPGSEDNLLEKSYYALAHVDPGADVSLIPMVVAEAIYGQEIIPFRDVAISVIGEIKNYKTAPILIGVEMKGGQVLYAQIDCFVSEEIDIVSIGNDFLSRLGLNVIFDYKKKKVILDSYDWVDFEKEVSIIYRSLGAKVKENVPLGGFQIDLVIDEITSSRQHIIIAVECKFHKEQVGNRIVNDFNRIIQTLKENRLVDKGAIVSFSGFTKDARLVAEKAGIDLFTIDDLRQIVTEHGLTISSKPVRDQRKSTDVTLHKRTQKNRRFFTIMPFTPELDDLYHLGIREVIAKIGGACERADEIQDVGGIVEKIYELIQDADVIIAEVTEPNPNVYYEVGYAHALGKPVVLLTRNIQNSPFDLRMYHHVIYSSIMDLRQRLLSILEQITKSLK